MMQNPEPCTPTPGYGAGARTLFDIAAVARAAAAPVPLRRDAPETSRRAARRVRSDAMGRRLRVLELLAERGHFGATDEEIAAALALDGNSARPLRWTLRNRGLVVDSGRVRRTRSGARATVWVLADLAADHASAPEGTDEGDAGEDQDGRDTASPRDGADAAEDQAAGACGERSGHP